MSVMLHHGMLVLGQNRDYMSRLLRENGLRKRHLSVGMDSKRAMRQGEFEGNSNDVPHESFPHEVKERGSMRNLMLSFESTILASILHKSAPIITPSRLDTITLSSHSFFSTFIPINK